MGNRGGALHNDRREIIRQYKSRQWIACVLEFKGRRRKIMAPNRYTELFFLDEAVAFAAGHRPCAECRRERFNAFKCAWSAGVGTNRPESLRAGEIDAELHRARIDPTRNKVTYQGELRALPNGCFIEVDRLPYLIWNDALLLWTPEGYAKKEQRPESRTVTVLTPAPIVECFRYGYEPQIHDSSRHL
jgi:hypothetical protein